jgi:hypothetical protein
MAAEVLVGNPLQRIALRSPHANKIFRDNMIEFALQH